MDKARIFISYAREDENAVRLLYRKLSDAGFIPWMDKVDLLPGEQWRPAIEKALRKADFLIICLSNTSVQKRGFVRREFRAALDLWQEKHDDDIYIIPVRLENCDPPDELDRFQWLDLFEDDEWPRLIRALQEGMRRRGNTLHVQRIIESASRQKTLEQALPAPTDAHTKQKEQEEVAREADVSALAERREKRRGALDAILVSVLIVSAYLLRDYFEESPLGPWVMSTYVSWMAMGLIFLITRALWMAMEYIVQFTRLFWNSAKSMNGEAALPPSAEAMHYWLELENDAGNCVSGLDPLPPGERFQLHFKPSEGGYFYLIARGEGIGRAWITFVTKHWIDAGSDFQFPGGDNWIDVGRGAIFTVIFSPELLNEPSFLKEDGRRLTFKEEFALGFFEGRWSESTSPETNAFGDGAVVFPRKRSDGPLVFNIEVVRGR